MKKLLPLILIFFVGCVGSSEQRNPLDREGRTLWWQSPDVREWEMFVPPSEPDTTDDPWANFQEPELFPEDWSPAYRSPEDETYHRLRLYRELRRLKKENNSLKEKLDRHSLRPIIPRDRRVM